MTDKRAKVQINYRSGNSMVVRCKSFSVERHQMGGGLVVEWEELEPNPLLIGVGDIESVWDLS